MISSPNRFNDPKTLASPTFPPAVLHVSKAARESALLNGCYSLIVIDDNPMRRHRDVSRIYINLGCDVVFLDRSAQRLIDPHFGNYGHLSMSFLSEYCKVSYPRIAPRFSGLFLIRSLLGDSCSLYYDYCWVHQLRDAGSLRTFVTGPSFHRGIDGMAMKFFNRSVERLLEERPGLEDVVPAEIVCWEKFFGGTCVLLGKDGHFRPLPREVFPVRGIVVSDSDSLHLMTDEDVKGKWEEYLPRFRKGIWRGGLYKNLIGFVNARRIRREAWEERTGCEL